MTTILLLHLATDYTGNSALEQCKLSSLPFGWDDPATSKDVSFFCASDLSNGKEIVVVINQLEVFFW